MSLSLHGLKSNETALETLLNATRELKRKGQHRHELLILSCYVNFDSLRSVVDSVAKIVKLTTVRFLFDYADRLKYAPHSETAKELNKIRGGFKLKRMLLPLSPYSGKSETTGRRQRGRQRFVENFFWTAAVSPALNRRSTQGLIM